MGWQQCLKCHQDTGRPPQEMLVLQHLYLPAVRNVQCDTFLEKLPHFYWDLWQCFPWGQRLGRRLCDSSFCTRNVFLHLNCFSSLKLQKCVYCFLGTVLLAFKLLGTRKHRLWWEYNYFIVESYYRKFVMEKIVLKIITVGHLNPSSAEFLVRLQHRRQICAHLKYMKWNPRVAQAHRAVAIKFSGARVLPTITLHSPIALFISAGFMASRILLLENLK